MKRAAFRRSRSVDRRPRSLVAGAWLLVALAGAAAATGCRSKETLPPPLDVGALIDQLLPDVERIAALRATGRVQVGLKTPEEVRAYVQQQLDRDMPPDRLEGVRLTYVMLGLLPPDLDLHQLLIDLYQEQLAGFYDPATKTLYAVDGIPPATLMPVLAHELVHALQDQIVNLDSLISSDRGNDRSMAAQAAIEGHATLAMLAWVAEQNAGKPVVVTEIPDVAATMRRTFDAQRARFPVYARAPRIIRDALVFPYASGASFVQRLWQRPGHSPEPPFGPLLPQSTEQVMQPDAKMFDHLDMPTDLRFDTVAGWTVRHDDSMGAMETTIFTEEHVGLYGAEGWDGDRVLLLESPAGQRVLEWASVWDDSASAAHFESIAKSVLASPSLGRPGVVEMDSVENRPLVRLIIADQPETLEAAPRPAVHCTDERGRPASCAPEDQKAPS